MNFMVATSSETLCINGIVVNFVSLEITLIVHFILQWQRWISRSVFILDSWSFRNLQINLMFVRYSVKCGKRTADQKPRNFAFSLNWDNREFTDIQFMRSRRFKYPMCILRSSDQDYIDIKHNLVPSSVLRV